MVRRAALRINAVGGPEPLPAADDGASISDATPDPLMEMLPPTFETPGTLGSWIGCATPASVTGAPTIVAVNDGIAGACPGVEVGVTEPVVMPPPQAVRDPAATTPRKSARTEKDSEWGLYM